MAFILALGKFTESPFRAMDEYDVFMDAVNRRIATQTLLEFALEESNMQFVLLTPQVGLCVSNSKRCDRLCVFVFLLGALQEGGRGVG